MSDLPAATHKSPGSKRRDGPLAAGLIALVIAASVIVPVWPRVLPEIERQIDAMIDARLKAQADAALGSVQKDVADLQSRVSSLETASQSNQDELGRVHNSSAAVSTDGNGYGLVQTSFGPFLVVARSATPYLDGYKVHLEIGNITSAALSGAKIHVEWGLPWYEVKDKGFEAVNESRKRKDFDVITLFASGTYTGADVFLSPAKADEVKVVEITLEFKQVALPNGPY